MMSGDDLIWTLELFDNVAGRLIEECIIPCGIAFQILHSLGHDSEYNTPVTYSITSDLFLSAYTSEESVL